MRTEHEQLKLVTSLTWALAGVSALMALFVVPHLILGIGMIHGQSPFGAMEPLPPEFGWLVVTFAILWIVGSLGLAVCLAFAARFLAQRRRYLYCLVMGGLACMFFPVGTSVGVLTVFILSKESVKALFAPDAEPPAS